MNVKDRIAELLTSTVTAAGFEVLTLKVEQYVQTWTIVVPGTLDEVAHLLIQHGGDPGYVEITVSGPAEARFDRRPRLFRFQGTFTRPGFQNLLRNLSEWLVAAASERMVETPATVAVSSASRALPAPVDEETHFSGRPIQAILGDLCRAIEDCYDEQAHPDGTEQDSEDGRCLSYWVAGNLGADLVHEAQAACRKPVHAQHQRAVDLGIQFVMQAAGWLMSCGYGSRDGIVQIEIPVRAGEPGTQYVYRFAPPESSEDETEARDRE